jgi:hypothetical protein
MNRIAAAIACLLLPFIAACAGPIHKAIASRDMPALEKALADGEDVNDPRGRIEPVAYACIHGNFEALKVLVEKGARLNGLFTTPLSMCAYHGRLDMVKYLVEHGEAVLDADIKGIESQPEIRRYLVEARRRTLAVAAPSDARPSAPASPAAREPSSDIDAPVRRAAERPDDYALVIGIEEYQSVPKADFGARDAKTVRKHLEALGFPARNIISLEGSQATGNKLKSYLEEWLPLNVKANSTLFVYYSGHGAPDAKTGDAYLVPWDGDPKFLKSTALPLKAFYSSLAKTKAKRVIVALDACFSGAGGRSVLAQGARPLVAKTAELSPPEGKVTVLAAASGDEITGTLQEQSHGLFTYHLLKGLAADPQASAQSLFDYLKPRVQDDARRENREQTPVLAGAALDRPLLAP